MRQCLYYSRDPDYQCFSTSDDVVAQLDTQKMFRSLIDELVEINRGLSTMKHDVIFSGDLFTQRAISTYCHSNLSESATITCSLDKVHTANGCKLFQSKSQYPVDTLIVNEKLNECAYIYSLDTKVTASLWIAPRHVYLVGTMCINEMTDRKIDSSTSFVSGLDKNESITIPLQRPILKKLKVCRCRQQHLIKRLSNTGEKKNSKELNLTKTIFNSDRYNQTCEYLYIYLVLRKSDLHLIYR